MMDLAAVILATMSLTISVVCITLMLAKNFFSTHTIQYVDPLKDAGIDANEMGSAIFEKFREIGDPIDADEVAAAKEKYLKKVK